MAPNQLRFIREYPLDCNGTKAAIRAGYSPKRAAQTAYELLQNPDIRAAIEKRLDELAMSSAEATKRMGDIAATRMQDYMVVREVLETPMVRKSLTKIIAEIEAEIEDEETYANRSSLSDKEEKAHHKEQLTRKRKIIRYRIELERNPDAYRDVAGEAQYVKRASIDLVKLAESPDKGLIKKFKFTEFGPEVELADAQGAIETILKMHGKLVQKVDVDHGFIPVDTSKLTEAERAALLAVSRQTNR